MEFNIRTAIEGVLKDLSIEGVDFSVEHPSDMSHGDYASNVALTVMQHITKLYETKTSKGTVAGSEGLIFNSPFDLAQTIIERLKGKIRDVENIEIAGPGFINFFLRRDFFSEKIAEANRSGDSWGKNSVWKGKKVIVEYTDPNPFKEFHIGHLFTNTVGEALARLFVMSGADTKRVNYQGDVGLHVACAVWGMQELGFTGVPDFTAQELGKAYTLGAKAYKENEKATEAIQIINKEIYERSDDVINVLYDKGRTVSLAYFETIYEIIGTQFDEYFFESETGPIGKKLVLGHPELFVESDGARVFEGEKYGLHTRVFLNSEGLPTYEAKELALAKLKEERLGTYDLSIISTSHEINEYFKVLKKAMNFVYPELEKKTEHVGHGNVRLATGKMSSRTGEIISALDFIHEIKAAAVDKMKEDLSATNADAAEEIAIGAIKYATLRGSIFQDSVFNKEQALSFEGDSGPYLQYTYARIVSVLEKAEQAGVVADVAVKPLHPYEVERVLYQFSEVVQKAMEDREPHKVVGYLTKLAGAFNTFYANEKIVDVSDEHAPYKLALSLAVKTTLKNGLWVLGIEALERM